MPGFMGYPPESGHIPASRHLLVTVHGIRTFGQWQERLGALVRAKEPQVSVYHYKYGYFSVLAFLTPFLRWIVTRRFRRDLLLLCNQHVDARIDIVAHSFGTHLVGHALIGLPSGKRPHLHTLILAGSVLKSSFPWLILFQDGTVQRVVNECGIRDRVLILNQLIVLFTGMAGLIGFEGMVGDRFVNNFYPFGHSGYFECNGIPSDQHMEERWVPWLTSNAVLPCVPRKNASLSGLLVFFAKNSEPFKLTAYLTPCIILIASFMYLYFQAESRRQKLHATNLVLESERLAKSDLSQHNLSILLAMASYKEAPSEEAENLLLRTLNSRNPEPRLQIAISESSIKDAAFSADGKSIEVVTGELGHSYSFEEGKLLFSFPTGGYDRNGPLWRTAKFSPDGRYLLVDEKAGQVGLWNFVQAKKILTTSYKSPDFSNTVFSPDSSAIAITQTASIFTDFEGNTLPDTEQVQADIYRPEKGNLLYSIKLLEGALVHLAFTNHADKLIAVGMLINSGNWTWNWSQWMASGSKPIAGGGFSIRRAENLIESPDGSLALIHNDGIVLVSGDGKTYSLTRDPMTCGAFSPDGTVLALGGVGKVSLWDVTRRRRVGEFQPGMRAQNLVFSPHGRFVAASDGYGTFVVYDPTTLQSVLVIKYAKERVSKMMFSPDERHLVLIGEHQVQDWPVKEELKIANLSISKGISAAAFRPDGQLLAIGGNDGVIKGWRFLQDNNDFEIQRSAWMSIEEIVFSPNGKYLGITEGVSGSFERSSVGFALAADGNIFNEVALQPKGNTELEFSPDSNRLLVRHQDDGKTDTWVNRTENVVQSQVRRIKSTSPDWTDYHDGREESERHETFWFRNNTELWSIVTDDVSSKKKLVRFNAESKQPISSEDLAAGKLCPKSISSTGEFLISYSNTSRPPQVVSKLRGESLLASAVRKNPDCSYFWFSPDQTKLLQATSEGLNLYTENSGKVFAFPLKQSSNIMYETIAFSNDSRFVIAVDTSGKGKIWDTTKPDQTSWISPDSMKVTNLILSLDNRYTALIGKETVIVRLWRNEDILKSACSILAGDDFSTEEHGKYFPDESFKPSCPHQ